MPFSSRQIWPSRTTRLRLSSSPVCRFRRVCQPLDSVSFVLSAVAISVLCCSLDMMSSDDGGRIDDRLTACQVAWNSGALKNFLPGDPEHVDQEHGHDTERAEGEPEPS